MFGARERLVFVDLETGGLDPSRPIIQIGAIAVDGWLRELETFEVKIRFDESEATLDSLRKQRYNRTLWQSMGRTADEAASTFARFLRRYATVDLFSGQGRPYQVAQLAAHHAAFDGPFLRAWYERRGIFLPAAYRVLCTVQRAAWLFEEDKRLTPPGDYKLLTLAHYFGVPFPKGAAHDALADIRATVGVYRAIVESTKAMRAEKAA